MHTDELYVTHKRQHFAFSENALRSVNLVEISENDLGKLDKDTLKICSSEKIHGLHLAELFNSN